MVEPVGFIDCYTCDGSDPECHCRHHPWSAQRPAQLPYFICASRLPAIYNDLVQQYYWIEKGILPNQGALLDQPAAYVDVMPMVSSLVNKAQQEVIKREKDK